MMFVTMKTDSTTGTAIRRNSHVRGSKALQGQMKDHLPIKTTTVRR